MTKAVNGRRLDGLEIRSCRSGAESGQDPGAAFNAAVEQVARRKRQERDGAIAMVEFALALAGTAMEGPVMEVPANPLPAVDGNPQPEPPAPRQKRPAKVEPLDPRKTYTWFEIMNHPSSRGGFGPAWSQPSAPPLPEPEPEAEE